MNAEAYTLLKNRKLKATSQRLLIVQVLLNSSAKTLLLSELLEQLRYKMNRSTVYRSLNALVQNEVVSKMVDANGNTLYTLNVTKNSLRLFRPFLKCNCCGELEQLPLLPADYINVLNRSGVENFNVVLAGYCSNCSKDQHITL